MDREASYRRYYEVLELKPGAPLAEIRKAYIRLKELYSTDSLAILAIDDEISADYRTQILEQIQEAYHRLRSLLDKEQHSSMKPIGGEEKPALSPTAMNGTQTYSGPMLQRIREERRVGLDAIAAATRVPIQSLENIEREDFKALPAEVFTRGFVVGYARHLALDVDKVVADYMQRYGEWKARSGKRTGSRFLARLAGKK
jgi:hypothetical protein